MCFRAQNIEATTLNRQHRHGQGVLPGPSGLNVLDNTQKFRTAKKAEGAGEWALCVRSLNLNCSTAESDPLSIE